jgi:quercetin dioxygenase-like cupin family protein
MREYTFVDPATLEWSPAPPDLPAGAMLKVLSADAESGVTAAIVKFPAGYVEPRHGHRCGHDILIMQGKLVDLDTGKEVPKGTYLYAPAGNIHGYRVPKDEDCIFFVFADGPLFPLVKPG